jgi:diaminopimelate decarboxylase
VGRIILKSANLGLRDHLRFEQGQLALDGFSCELLAGKYGTPLYVLSENRIRRNFRSFQEALTRLYERILVCPAYKANSHLAVARIYQSEGAGAEVVSGNELKVALDSGVRPEMIVFNGPCKRTKELELAVSSEIGLINADSVAELKHLEDVAMRVGKRCNVGIRINLDIRPETHPHLATSSREHKFGIWVRDALRAYKEASVSTSLNVVGVHCHIGSNISEPRIFRQMTNKIIRLVVSIHEIGLTVTKIDLGGGLGFRYQPNAAAISNDEYAFAVLGGNLKVLKRLGNPMLIFEPGRRLIADAGVLLTTVATQKHQGNTEWGIVDAGMSTFLRPALYGAKHQVVAVRNGSAKVQYNLGGPCCESADVIARNVKLPKLSEGDLLAVLDVGAYGFTMASNYNGQARPSVVLVSEGRDHLIRRREEYEDLIAGERVPAHLREK